MFDINVIIHWIRKNITKKDVLIIVGLAALYACTRLLNLKALPIFSDEGIYIEWSRVAWKDASLRFISLTDGRQPLQTWATIPFLKLLPNQALVAGRLFSVSAGLFALSGLVSSVWYLFNKRTAYIAGLLYIVTPYFLFYDRIALVDSAVNGFTLWMFFFSVLLARTLRLDVAIILGFLSGFALLGKSSVRLYAGLMLFGSVLVVYSHEEGGILGMLIRLKDKLMGKDNKLMKLVSYLILYGVVLCVAILIYNVQRLSPYLHLVEMKNTTFVLTLSELIQTPFAYFPHNIVNIPYYIIAEMGYVVALLGILGMFALYKKDRTLTLYLLLWFVIPIIALSFLAKVLFPRYVLSLGGLLLIPAAYLISQIKSNRNLVGVAVLILLSVSFFNYAIWFQPSALPMPSIDRGQYLEGWPAGFGAEEIVDFAREKAQEKRVYLLAAGNFGMAGDVLRTFVREGDNIHVRAYWPLDDTYLFENQAELPNSHVFVVYGHCKEINHEDEVSDADRCSNYENTKPLKLIQKFDKPGDKSAIYLFELLPAE